MCYLALIKISKNKAYEKSETISKYCDTNNGYSTGTDITNDSNSGNGSRRLFGRHQQCVINVTSLWARSRLKSPASRMVDQPFVQAQIKENIKDPRHGLFVRGIHWWPVESPIKGPVTWKMFPFDDVIMASQEYLSMVRD